VTSINKYDDGVAPSKLVRVASFALLLIGATLVFIPPGGFWSIVAMIFALVGLLRITRGHEFPNTWWFWFFSAIAFLQSSGMVFPITKFEFPTRNLPLASYYLGCIGSLASGLLGITMFLRYAWADLRAGRIRFEDD
jgi:hypothetical protein